MKRVRICNQANANAVDARIEERAHFEDSHDRTSRSSAWKTGALLLMGAVGTLALANALIFARAPKVGNRLGGAFGRYPSRYGDLAYTVSGVGKPPLLLLHGFGIGNSAFEWRQNIDALAEHYSVYALDFLGWGLPDKYQHSHTADDYIEVVGNFLEDIVAEPCVVVASGGAAPIVIEAAARAPHNVDGLVLICPSLADDAGHIKLPRELLQKALQMPIVSTGFYNFMSSRAQIEQFARRHLFFDKSLVDEAFVQRYHATAHQSAAQFGVFAFLSGALSIDAREAWSRLRMPTLLVWGRNAQLNPLETAPEWMALKPDTELAVIDNAMLLPHVEHPQRFNALLQRWVDGLPDKHAASGADHAV